MKKIAKKILLIISGLLAVVFLPGCLDGDETSVGQIDAFNQVISQNRLLISSATIGQRGWLTASPAGSSGEPLDSILLGSAILLNSAGTFRDLPLQLANSPFVKDTMKIWFTLHEDTGVKGMYEYTGSNNLDNPIRVDGFSIRQSIMAYAPRIIATSQAVAGQTVVIDEAVVGAPAWLVVYAATEQGSISDELGRIGLDPGIHESVKIELDESLLPAPGDQIIALLHVNAEPYNDFDFPGSDDFEMFGYGMTSYIGDTITILE